MSTIQMNRLRGSHRFMWFCRAEILKIFKFRFLKAAYAGLFILTGACAVKLFSGGASELREGMNGLQAAAIVFSYSWSTLLFHLLIISFSISVVLIENQYGMIRVTCTQPLSRLQYLAGKLLAVFTHVGLFTGIYLASHVFWSLLLWGGRGLSRTDILRHSIFWVYTMLFTWSLSGIAVGTGLYRRSIASGMITAWCIIMALFIMASLSSDSGKYVFFTYGFYPLAPLTYIDGAFAEYVGDKSLAGYLGVTLLTPLMVGLPAAMRFLNRDITE